MPDAARLTFVNYMPAEICLLLSHDRAVDPGRVHAALVAALGARIRRRLGGTTPGAKVGPLPQDLTPGPDLRRVVGGDPLTPLDRPAASPGPVIELRRPGGRVRTLHFLQIGALGQQTDESVVRVQLEATRQLVNLVNREMRGPLGDELPGSLLEAAGPNWLTAAANSCNSPGARPDPLLAAENGKARWHFVFGDKRLQRDVEAARSGPTAHVTVAVLDTCPSDDAVERAAARFPDNWLLRDVRARVPRNPPLGDLPPPSVAPPERFVLNLGNAPIARHALPTLLVPDHGLFAAGIVRDVVRDAAEVSLVRVLGDSGIGDFWALASVVRQLPGRFLRDDLDRLVVNLSLSLDVPSDDRKLSRWFPATAEQLESLRASWTEINDLIGSAELAIRVLFEWLVSHERVLVVAAAGNDHWGPSPTGELPYPRMPARFEGVLSVGATTLGDEPAAYTNRADVGILNNGVAVWGGDARVMPLAALSAPTGAAAVARGVDLGATPVDAVIGVYTALEFPLSAPDRRTNETGWAYWAGTSFAAPIVSGIAACQWAINPDLSRDALIRATRQYGTHRGTPDDPDGLMDAPLLAVRQAP